MSTVPHKKLSKVSIVASLAILAAVGVWWFVWRPGASGRKPDVVVIVVDTLRADFVGWNGKRLIDGSSPTPHLDRWAERVDGPKVALTPVPLTLPAHTTMMSGYWPDVHGVRENDSFRVPTAAEGRTYSLLSEDFAAAGYATAAFVSGQPLERRTGIDQGFTVYSQPGAEDRAVTDSHFRERKAESTIDEALSWMEAQKAKGADRKPFFLFVHLFDPHDPYLRRHDHPGLPAGRIGDYLAEIEYADRQLGRLLEALPGGREGTVLAFTADHGEGLGEHGELTHGHMVHDATLKIPFFLSRPTSDGRSLRGDLPARLVDLRPTLFEAAGLDALAAAEARDGESLFGERKKPWRHYAESLYPWLQFRYASVRVYRDPEHKLTTGGRVDADTDGPRRELFAWPSDALEDRDQAGSLPERVEALSGALRTFALDRARKSAERLARDPSASDPYIGGGHAVGLAVEPPPAVNRTLPRVEDRWVLLDDLHRAIRLIASRVGAPEAVAVLSKHQAEVQTNPALLFWLARAHQWAGRKEDLGVDSKAAYLKQAGALYAQHHQLHDDPRSFDSGLKVLLDLHEATEEDSWLREAIRRATGEINSGGGRKLTLVFRGLAARELGMRAMALEDFRAAAKLDPEDQQLRLDLQRLEEE